MYPSVPTHPSEELPAPGNNALHGWPWTEATDPALYGNGEGWPKISIITPSYNQGHYLEQTIRSVLAQNYPNLEYMIIDGGSTDNSVDLIRKYSSRIHYWVSEPDKGQSDALGKGFRLATGELSAWINSDDFYEAGALYKVAQQYRQQPFSLLCGTCRMIDMDDHLIQKLHTPSISYRSLLRYWKPHFCPPQPSIFFRTEILKDLGYFDPSLRYAMDYDLWLKASSKYRFHSIPDNLSYYRIHADSKSGSYGGLRKFIPEWKRVIERSLHKQSLLTRYAHRLEENLHFFKHRLRQRFAQ